MTTRAKKRRAERRKRRLQARGHGQPGTAPLPPPNPGQALLCRTCAHFAAEAWNNGHPSPCRRFRWVDQKHVSPIMVGTAEGVACSDFEEKRD
ncbi:MAG: hypothetical protein ABIK89_13170 [Planctomycetota bacterium]